MRLELTGRHVDITPALRRLVTKKLAKLERVLNDSAVSAQIVLTRERHRHRTDVTLHARDERFLHGFGVSTDWEASIADAIERMSQQVQKLKGKWQSRKRQGPAKDVAAAALEPGEGAPRRPSAGGPRRERPRMPKTLRAERQVLQHMSVPDAVRQVDGARAPVVIFVDTETSSVSVLYRNSSGELTLVQADT
jgi:putative sigma-54 modulation protein